MRESDFTAIEMSTVKEKCCIYCKIPDVYAKWHTCSKAHEFKETGNDVPKFYAAKTFINNPVKRMIGYEVEVSDYVKGRECTEFARKIGAGMCLDCAFEMQTPPANGDELVRLVKEVSAEIRKNGAICQAGSGLHTHVDCRDLSYEDIRKVCVLYGKTEGALYSIIDPRRAVLNWAKPVGGPELVKTMSDPRNATNAIVKFVYGGKENLKLRGRRDKDPRGGDRYLGLNLHSWFMRGTIEFRMHHGTTKWDKMLNWGMLLGGMVETAANAPARDVENWPTGKEGMLKYAPTDGVREWINKRWEYFATKRKNKDEPLF